MKYNKSIKLVMKPGFTGLGNYASCTACPIAKSLKAAGFVNVIVGPTFCSFTKMILGFIPFHYRVVFNDHIVRQAHIWSENKITEPIYFEI